MIKEYKLLFLMVIIFSFIYSATLIMNNQCGWTVHNITDAITDEQSTTIILHSENEVMGKKHSLIIKCKQDSIIDIYITWHARLERLPKVTVRFDKGVAVQSEWTISKELTATFCNNTTLFIKKLLKSGRLAVRTTSYQGSVMTAVFNVEGLSDVISVPID